MSNKVVVIGGGASGFFTAINLAMKNQETDITILEKTSKTLSKVRISGGGRCNVTHTPSTPSNYSKNYPRGPKHMQKLLKIFSADDTLKWFKKQDIDFHTESDGRIFPISNSSETIINCFHRLVKRYKINVKLNFHVESLEKTSKGKFKINGKGQQPFFSDYLVIAIGGSPKLASYEWIGLKDELLINPYPSLFTFKTPKSNLKQLLGISVPQARIKISSTKYSFEGPLLITHWGFSGPAILKLSSFAAEYLFEKDYHFNIQINWDKDFTEEKYHQTIKQYQEKNPKRLVFKNCPFDFPLRLWQRLIENTGVKEQQTWVDIGKKQRNKIVERLFNCTVEVHGKTTFKEEFVTAGGISLEALNSETLECKELPNLYFTGEVINVDGITGGFNFQHAWSSGFTVAQAINNQLVN